MSEDLPLNGTGFGIGIAIGFLKRGRRVARRGWNGKGMWLGYKDPSEDMLELMTLPYIYMKTADGGLVPWLASQTDILAEDWVMVTG